MSLRNLVIKAAAGPQEERKILEIQTWIGRHEEELLKQMIRTGPVTLLLDDPSKEYAMSDSNEVQPVHTGASSRAQSSPIIDGKVESSSLKVRQTEHVPMELETKKAAISTDKPVPIVPKKRRAATKADDDDTLLHGDPTVDDLKYHGPSYPGLESRKHLAPKSAWKENSYNPFTLDTVKARKKFQELSEKGFEQVERMGFMMAREMLSNADLGLYNRDSMTIDKMVELLDEDEIIALACAWLQRVDFPTLRSAVGHETFDEAPHAFVKGGKKVLYTTFRKGLRLAHLRAEEDGFYCLDDTNKTSQELAAESIANPAALNAIMTKLKLSDAFGEVDIPQQWWRFPRKRKDVDGVATPAGEDGEEDSEPQEENKNRKNSPGSPPPVAGKKRPAPPSTPSSQPPRRTTPAGYERAPPSNSTSLGSSNRRRSQAQPAPGFSLAMPPPPPPNSQPPETVPSPQATPGAQQTVPVLQSSPALQSTPTGFKSSTPAAPKSTTPAAAKSTAPAGTKGATPAGQKNTTLAGQKNSTPVGQKKSAAPSPVTRVTRSGGKP